jgi:hypothetical protein
MGSFKTFKRLAAVQGSKFNVNGTGSSGSSRSNSSRPWRKALLQVVPPLRSVEDVKERRFQMFDVWKICT